MTRGKGPACHFLGEAHRKAFMVVLAGVVIAGGRDVDQPGEIPWESRQRAALHVLDGRRDVSALRFRAHSDQLAALPLVQFALAPPIRAALIQSSTWPDMYPSCCATPTA